MHTLVTAQALTIEDRVTVPASAFTHDGYRTWVKSPDYPERIRTTYVEREVLVEMSPESAEAHSKVKAAITAALQIFVRDRDLGEVYPDGMLVTNESAGLSCEPDLTFVSWASFEEGHARLAQRVSEADYIEIVGSPDVVVEIVSDSSVVKDTRRLRHAYARAGVHEYWLIDARADDLRFEILENTGTEFASGGDPHAPQTSAVLGGRWALTRTRNRVGRFAYRLDPTE